MKEGEVCPNEVKSDRNRLPNAARWSKARSSGPECRSLFQNEACSANIVAEFGAHLGNVGLVLIHGSRTDSTRSVADPYADGGRRLAEQDAGRSSSGACAKPARQTGPGRPQVAAQLRGTRQAGAPRRLRLLPAWSASRRCRLDPAAELGGVADRALRRDQDRRGDQFQQLEPNFSITHLRNYLRPAEGDGPERIFEGLRKAGVPE